MDVLAKHQEDLQKQLAAHDKKHANLHKRRDDINAKIWKLREDLEEVTNQIAAEDHPDRIKLSNEISRVAKARGAKSLSTPA